MSNEKSAINEWAKLNDKVTDGMYKVEEKMPAVNNTNDLFSNKISSFSRAQGLKNKDDSTVFVNG